MAVMKTKMLESQKKPSSYSKQSNTNEKKTLLLAQELKIARSLAGNEKVSRDRALKSLKKWLKHRSQNLAFTEEDFLRIWKGLFYSMWMSDKPLIQEECAENIASLLHELPFDHSLILFKCGLITLCKEWFGIDQLRLNKFLMFVRRLLRQFLVVLKKNGFQKDNIIQFGNVISETVLDSGKKDIMGLFLHFTEVYLEELAKVSEGHLKHHLVAEFLVPFIKTLTSSDDPRRIKQIRKFIFIHLMFQSDVGLEYQERYDAWKRQGFPGTIHAMQKVEIEEDKDSEEYDEEEGHLLEDKPLDPRAGRVDVVLPQIKFNPKLLADLLVKYKYTENSKVAARKTMTLLSKQLRKLAKGIYPLGVVDLRLPKDDIKDMNLKKSAKRLVKFENKLMGVQTKGRKRKMEMNEEVPVKKIKKKEERNQPKKINQMTNSDFLNMTKKYLKQGVTFKGDNTEMKKVVPQSLLSESGQMPDLVFEKFSGLWRVYNDVDTKHDKKTGASKSSLQKKEPATLENQEIFPNNPWDEPLKEREYEITIPSKKYVEKLKKISKKSSKNLQQLIDSSQIKFKNPRDLNKHAQCSTPERTKKVKINTSLNRSQEFEEYHTQVLSSPTIIFDGSKKPGKPLLKSTSSTPINPFYKKYKP
ncbi:ribosomal RNA processing protein 1 homolog [Coccinella septempunctata]|uniref:ribosomal RNA processing protein 1 homolog n=1 Tax=Coccinella septempunctata TaxID=41139 RepID=UPI001D07470C|nr:ribosomal RNA processing protein 1 homolog [Coccinella septempunctata]